MFFTQNQNIHQFAMEYDLAPFHETIPFSNHDVEFCFYIVNHEKINKTLK